MSIASPTNEWLEADGLGGFASGTVSGIRTRRYHALLLAATQPPTGRVVLVNGFDAHVETPSGSFPISSQRYLPDVVAPEGCPLVSFEPEPWPRWSFALPDGTRIEQEILVRHGAPLVAVAWRAAGRRTGVSLVVRPFLSGRDYHALHHENPELRFDAERRDGRVTWRPYASLPGVVALSNGAYAQEPHWYRGFLYGEERDRGLDHVEDLAAPGVFRFDLSAGEAGLFLAATPEGEAALPLDVGNGLRALRARERRRRRAFPTRLQRAADSYLVRRGRGRTILAGYPWFADWGRDTFIALRGLCLATGWLEAAGQILTEWAHAVSEGMLPNRFPDRPEDPPEFNSVDAALWYVVAVREYLDARAAARATPLPCQGCAAASGEECLRAAVFAILEGHRRGTRHGIRMDADGLLAAGEPGVQLTWMDAKVGDWVVTPRIGKPVEVQALWLNALSVGAAWDARWREPLERGRASFEGRFWNEARGCLHDVVDADHVPGAVDAALRPNQILAVGGLPLALLQGERARSVVEVVEHQLWTPLGLRSLARDHAGYVPHYEGGVRARDGAYHQGTVWPWLLGPFVEAWLRVRGGTAQARREASERFLMPLMRHLDEAGLGHVSEIADAESPHAPRGCPFQAWSVAEALRLERLLASAGQPDRVDVGSQLASR